MRTILRDNYTPEMGAYHETLVIDDARHKKYLFDCDGVFTDITNPLVVSERGDSEDFAASQKWVTEIDDKIDDTIEDLGDEIQARIDADNTIWEEIEEIEMSSDVVDIVGTYAELQQYDTSKLHDNDIIKVLQDETHQNETAYYRWSTSTDTFSYVGSEGPYYTESEIDTMMAGKQDVLTAGDGISISEQDVISIKRVVLYAATAGGDGNEAIALLDYFDGFYKDSQLTTRYTGQELLAMYQQGVHLMLSFADGEVLQVYDGDEGAVSVYCYGFNMFYDFRVNTYTGEPIKYISGHSESARITFQPQLRASSNISITPTWSQDGKNQYYDISATDTTYSAFTGATSSVAGTAGLVPAPTTSDPDKYLKGDGTWATITPGPTVVQVTGQSTSSVMSQKATTDMVFNPSNGAIQIGTNNYTDDESIGIGAGVSFSDSTKGVAIGDGATIYYADTATAIGYHTYVDNSDSVALGANSVIDSSRDGVDGMVSVGSSDAQDGFTRRIINVTDPTGNQDAATKHYVDTAISSAATTVVQTTGQSTTSVMSQKAVTDIIGDVESALQILNSGAGVP